MSYNSLCSTSSCVISTGSRQERHKLETLLASELDYHVLLIIYFVKQRLFKFNFTIHQIIYQIQTYIFFQNNNIIKRVCECEIWSNLNGKYYLIFVARRKTDAAQINI